MEEEKNNSKAARLKTNNIGNNLDLEIKTDGNKLENRLVNDFQYQTKEKLKKRIKNNTIAVTHWCKKMKKSEIENNVGRETYLT